MATTATIDPVAILNDACLYLREQWELALYRDDVRRGNVQDAYQIVWLAMMEVIGI